MPPEEAVALLAGMMGSEKELNRAGKSISVAYGQREGEVKEVKGGYYTTEGDKVAGKWKERETPQSNKDINKKVAGGNGSDLDQYRGADGLRKLDELSKKDPMRASLIFSQIAHTPDKKTMEQQYDANQSSIAPMPSKKDEKNYLYIKMGVGLGFVLGGTEDKADGKGGGTFCGVGIEAGVVVECKNGEITNSKAVLTYNNTTKASGVGIGMGFDAGLGYGVGFKDMKQAYYDLLRSNDMKTISAPLGSVTYDNKWAIGSIGVGKDRGFYVGVSESESIDLLEVGGNLIDKLTKNKNNEFKNRKPR